MIVNRGAKLKRALCAARGLERIAKLARSVPHTARHALEFFEAIGKLDSATPDETEDCLIDVVQKAVVVATSGHAEGMSGAAVVAQSVLTVVLLELGEE